MPRSQRNDGRTGVLNSAGCLICSIPIAVIVVLCPTALALLYRLVASFCVFGALVPLLNAVVAVSNCANFEEDFLEIYDSCVVSIESVTCAVHKATGGSTRVPTHCSWALGPV